MRARAASKVGRLLLVAVTVLLVGVAAAAAARQVTATTGTKYTVVSTWGTTGTGDGQFKGASGLGVDGNGNVYVADSGNYRIQKFDPAGQLLTKWGAIGKGQGQFTTPTDVSIDRAGNVWVADNGNYRLQRFTTGGANPTDGKPAVIQPGGQTLPDTVAVDAAGNVFEVEFFGNRVRRYDAASNWGAGPTWGTAGKSPGQFNRPRGVAASPDGSVYVADRDNYRVQRFDADGKFLNGWGSNGLGAGQFREARGVAVDPNCNVWVADGTAHRLQKFNSAGKLLGQIPNVFSVDVAVAPTGDIYALESTGLNQQVRRFRETPGPTPANAPKVLDLRYDPKTKTFLVGVPYTLDNIGCPNPLGATATLKTATGKALGTKAGLQLPLNHRTTIDIPIAKAAILGGGFKTAGSSTVARARLSVVLKTNGRDTLTVKDVKLRISIAAIKSGALPGLQGLLKHGAA